MFFVRFFYKKKKNPISFPLYLYQSTLTKSSASVVPNCLWWPGFVWIKQCFILWIMQCVNTWKCICPRHTAGCLHFWGLITTWKLSIGSAYILSTASFYSLLTRTVFQTDSRVCITFISPPYKVWPQSSYMLITHCISAIVQHTIGHLSLKPMMIRYTRSNYYLCLQRSSRTFG